MGKVIRDKSLLKVEKQLEPLVYHVNFGDGVDYLKEGGKVMFWDIPDPFRQTDVFADDVYKQVQQRVEQLVAEIG